MRLSSEAQFTGRVDSREDGKPIPFATLRWSENKGAYASDLGEFKIENQSDSLTVIVSCVGFKTDTFNLTKEFNKIVLELSLENLAPIVISDKELKSQRIGAPTNRKGSMSLGAKSGGQYALFIPSKAYKSGSLITRLHFNLNSGLFDPVNPKDSHFRIRLYNQINGLPYQDLLPNLVIKPSRNGGWESIELKQFRFDYRKVVFL